MKHKLIILFFCGATPWRNSRIAFCIQSSILILKSEKNQENISFFTHSCTRIIKLTRNAAFFGSHDLLTFIWASRQAILSRIKESHLTCVSSADLSLRAYELKLDALLFLLWHKQVTFDFISIPLSLTQPLINLRRLSLSTSIYLKSVITLFNQ